MKGLNDKWNERIFNWWGWITLLSVLFNITTSEGGTQAAISINAIAYILVVNTKYVRVKGVGK